MLLYFYSIYIFVYKNNNKIKIKIIIFNFAFNPRKFKATANLAMCPLSLLTKSYCQSSDQQNRKMVVATSICYRVINKKLTTAI